MPHFPKIRFERKEINTIKGNLIGKPLDLYPIVTLNYVIKEDSVVTRQDLIDNVPIVEAQFIQKFHKDNSNQCQINGTFQYGNLKGILIGIHNSDRNLPGQEWLIDFHAFKDTYTVHFTDSRRTGASLSLYYKNTHVDYKEVVNRDGTVNWIIDRTRSIVSVYNKENSNYDRLDKLIGDRFISVRDVLEIYKNKFSPEYFEELVSIADPIFSVAREYRSELNDVPEDR